MNKQETMRLIDNDIKRIEREILPEDKWLLLDKKELISYFEDFIWENKNFYQGITEKKEFGEFPKDFQNRVKEILEVLEDELSTIDFYFDDAEAFLVQNFWILVGDFISEGKVKEYVSLVREKCAFFLDENDEDCLSFIKTLENLEEFEGSK